MAKPMVSMSSPIFLMRRLFFCIKPTMKVQPSWPSSGSSSTSSSLITNWGFIQKLSGKEGGGEAASPLGKTVEPLHTWVVPAAASRRTPSPRVFELCLRPLFVVVPCERIWGEVADLEAGILAQEVGKWHPVDQQQGNYFGEEQTGEEQAWLRFTRTRHPPSGWSVSPCRRRSRISTRWNFKFKRVVWGRACN